MMTYIGTTAEQDLSEYNLDKIRLIKGTPDSGEEAFLKYRNIWFLTDQHGSCSCGFRSVEFPNVEALGFDVPQDWSPEDEESIQATHEIYDVILNLLKSGHKVESITFWVDSKTDFIDKTVSLESVTIDTFRFFDGYHFEYQINT
ncbi:MAG: hypothetical protein HY881_20655 [Deltaproteobacteria bacterium]|nr:hypothetical protein [Deltaproteobacteria bacterium]